jgi:nucleoside diphosphate kinase
MAMERTLSIIKPTAVPGQRWIMGAAGTSRADYSEPGTKNEVQRSDWAETSYGDRLLPS